jgi:DNA-binding Lrp family transcriptional regulator
MSQKDWRRVDIVERIGRGELTVAEAAQALGLSKRQTQRIRKRIRKKGAAGIIHGNTGRASKHKIGKLVRDRIVELWRERGTQVPGRHCLQRTPRARR